MSLKRLLGGIILSFASLTSPLFASNTFVVWNVGQGLWATHIQEGVCSHFDAGGEVAPSWHRLKSLCPQNRFYFSHWDWDHIRFIKQAAYWLPQTCVARWPRGFTNHQKWKMFQNIPHCQKISAFEWHWPWPQTFSVTSNGFSRVFLAEGVLLPGDSTKRMEQHWARHSKARFLILGHHGSKTATSPYLLKHLPQLKMAIASARKFRYGHPHPQVQSLLQKKKVSLVSTEEWGNIFIEL